MLFLAAILASGCAAEKVESSNDKPIRFTTLVGKQTRASEFTYWTTGETITVAAYKAGGSLFKNFTLEYEGANDPIETGNWTYGTPIPQPGIDLVYYSYYPAVGVAPALTATAGTLTYTIQAVQEDLIAATTTTGDAAVSLAFDHLLSQVNFAIQGAEGFKYQVTNIKINNVANAGTYTFGGAWSNLGNPEASYDYIPAGANITTGTDDSILYLGNHNGATTFDNALMLMPQGFDTPGVSSITFDYAILDAADDETLDSGSKTIDLSEYMAWEAGKRYLYVIDFTGPVITFTIIVNPWLDDEVIDVEP